MPEGPEIRQAADALHKSLAGRRVENIYFKFKHLEMYGRRLSGRRVTGVEARGKALLIHFSKALSIYSHNQLYGKWYVVDAGKTPDTNRDLRLAIHNRRFSALLYSASDIEVIESAALPQHRFLKRLGPDVLDSSVTQKAVVDRLLHRRFFRQRLHSLLLDQHFLSGPGNYLRSEILFAAKIHHQRRPVDLSKPELTKLASTILSVSRRSYRTKGLTNDPKVVKKLRAKRIARRDYRFAVYKREGQPCYVCGEKIKKKDIGRRYVFFCERCCL